MQKSLLIGEGVRRKSLGSWALAEYIFVVGNKKEKEKENCIYLDSSSWSSILCPVASHQSLIFSAPLAALALVKLQMTHTHLNMHRAWLMRALHF